MTVNNNKGQASLYGKLKITATLRLETGLHIGSASDFAPIGAVDSPFIRDPFTKQPIIPGSSLKGKMRTLLAKSYADTPLLPDIKNDCEEIKRLFGASDDNFMRPARLQFCDCHMTEASVKQFSNLETDTYLGEVKFENSINRLSAVANPRQLERVPAGAEFAFSLVYNVENAADLSEDMENLANAFKLLEMDYLGGHGSRGYGRVSFNNIDIEAFSIFPERQTKLESQVDKWVAQLEG